MPVPVPVPPDTYSAPQDEWSTALVPAAPEIPPEVSMNLLNSLLVFYHHERSWVQRTRASLELAFVQGPLFVLPSIAAPTDSQSDTDGSASSTSSSSSSSENTSNEPTPATTDSESDSSSGSRFSSDSMSPAVKQEEEEGSLALRTRFAPLTLRATAAARASSSRWLKRKQSFKLHLGSLSSSTPTRPRQQPQHNGPEPSAQLLELFGDLLEARMESCMRITRLVRDSNRAMLRSW
ncbi:hypothetical protein EW145_g1581 [Phellinidium pouzarii]|uniref:Uncharacterized protein n=1 Tax=Phellinidium pouzarii TaxID=167371 RepID=A0A4V3XDK9_9AGAM|nr:hypothetical protein EW145_g1581 [Phellinidium pouzarii]